MQCRRYVIAQLTSLYLISSVLLIILCNSDAPISCYLFHWLSLLFKLLLTYFQRLNRQLDTHIICLWSRSLRYCRSNLPFFRFKFLIILFYNYRMGRQSFVVNIKVHISYHTVHFPCNFILNVFFLFFYPYFC